MKKKFKVEMRDGKDLELEGHAMWVHDGDLYFTDKDMPDDGPHLVIASGRWDVAKDATHDLIKEHEEKGEDKCE